MVTDTLFASQAARQPIQISSSPQGSIYSLCDATATDGMHVAMTFRDGPLGDQDVFYAESLDGGLTYSPTVQLTNVSQGFSAEESQVLVAGGVRHVFHRVANFQSANLSYTRSIDGVTWSPPVTFTNGQQMRAGIDGQTLILAYRADFNGALRVLFSHDAGTTWSSQTIGGVGLGASLKEAAVSAGIAHVAWIDNFDAWYSRRAPGAGAFSPATRLDLAAPGVGSIISGIRVVADGNQVYAAWRESGRPGTTLNDLIFRASDDGGATWGPETFLLGAGSWVARVALGAEGDTVVAAFTGGLPSSSTDVIAACTSTDGGSTWTAPVPLVYSSSGGYSPNYVNAFVSGGLLFIIAQEHYDRNLFLSWSSDGGASWSDLSPLSPFATGYSSMDGAAITADGVVAQTLHNGFIHALGIRHPFLSATVSGSTATLEVQGVDRSFAGEWVRFAVSSSIASQASFHPNLSGAFLDLVPSPLLSASLGIPQALSAQIQADGSALRSLIIPPALTNRTVYLQSWVVTMPGAFGELASDPFRLVIP